MTRSYYIRKILDCRHSIALHALEFNHRSISGVVEVDKHPPCNTVLKYKVAHVREHKRSIYVLIGKVNCNFIDGISPKWFEIAYSLDGDELRVWRDLNVREG